MTNHSPQQNKQDWEEEFDKQFPTLYNDIPNGLNVSHKVKSFIHDLLKKQEQSIRSK